MKLENKKILVTGGAGFIGSNLVEFLLARRGIKVVVYDNLSLGKKEFIAPFLKNSNFRFIKGDLLDKKKLGKEIRGIDIVFHLAANSDIRYGMKHPEVELKNGTIATANLLEVMRENNVREIVFTSTSAVYGDKPKVIPTPEDYGPLFPISFYGANKLASEALISAYCHNFGFRAWIFRFANIVGKNATHGVVFDFIRKLKDNPKELVILGNGKQAKPYLHVKECIEGMIYGVEKANDQLNYFNLACKGATAVNKIAQIVIQEMGLEDVKLRYTGGERGWPGDVPQVRLDPRKMKRLGWEARLSSDQAIRLGVKELLNQL
ncbi:NAD-dependent epimerase/dehydratase family protein [bacterium]|nr:NAD-dependent epimerase/dehydratase family protein [bacterium]